ncbi:hypothetical protein LC607_35610, partial [Nostoc sp. CHAB 5824]|nr:hypothetical protein [Nostoc sp. CHAB 5824]
GRKRGTTMEILVGIATGVGVIAGWIISAMLSNFDIVDAIVMGLSDPLNYLAIGLAVFAAVSRVRHL